VGALQLSQTITLGRYVYEDIYPAFKAATDEKEITARINRTFLNYLAARDLVLTGPAPAVVADIGCGPCNTLVRYLAGVSFPPGFIVRATDFIPKYADREHGEAVRTLKTAQAAKAIKLVAFETRAGNAFASNLLDLLSASKDRTTMRLAFSVAFASHVIYHADASSDVQRLLPMLPTISSPAMASVFCITLPKPLEPFRSFGRISEVVQALPLRATREQSRLTIHPLRSESRAKASVYLFMKPLLRQTLGSDD